MTQDRKRTKIAEACGWTHDQVCHCWRSDRHFMKMFSAPPDYFSDLNAMHEAEKVLEGGGNWNRYTDALGKLRHYKPEIHGLRSFVNIIVSATASQRAEAFGLTLNLWTTNDNEWKTK